MKSPEQLKGAIRNIAAKKNLRPQEVLQMFLFERILERLAKSPYSSNFILKGGLLISSMIGISERTTMDMDTTVRGITMEEDEIVEVLKKILAVDVQDGVEFVFESIEPIREEDAYNNFRAHLKARYGKINAPMKMVFSSKNQQAPENTTAGRAASKNVTARIGGCFIRSRSQPAKAPSAPANRRIPRRAREDAVTSCPVRDTSRIARIG